MKLHRICLILAIASIGLITEPLNLLNAADRLRGYKRALRARGFASDAKYIRQGNNREDSGYWRALELFKLPQPYRGVGLQ